MQYRPEIDGLRAIAVLSVVIYHVAPAALPSGFLGVDVFFVISGFLITSLLRDEWQRTGRIDLADFYARRIRRLLPALVLVIGTTVALSAFLLPYSHAPTLASAAASLLFVANVYFQRTTVDYFAQAAEETPLLHLWSLGVEEQFYVLWPLLLLVVLSHRPALWIAALGVASLAWHSVASDAAAFFGMPARFWELAAGGLVAFAPALPRHRAPVAALAALALLWALAAASHQAPAVLASGALLWAVRSGATGTVGALLASRPFGGAGLISYSLYLWHWPLLAVYGVRSLGAPDLQVRILLAVLAIVLAALSYRFVERPFRRATLPSRRVIQRGAVVLGFCVAGVGIAAVQVTTAPISDRVPVGRCDITYGQALPDDILRTCVLGEGLPRVVIWGDSHARAWQPLALEIARHRGSALISFSRDQCRPWTPGAMRDECAEFNEAVTRHLSILRPTTVILAARWKWLLVDREAPEKLRSIVGMLSAAGADVVLIGPVPELRYRPPECIRAGNPTACEITAAEFAQQAEPINAVLRTLPADLIDPGPYFCGSGRCVAEIDGTATLYDEHHVTRTAAGMFARAHFGVER